MQSHCFVRIASLTKRRFYLDETFVRAYKSQVIVRKGLTHWEGCLSKLTIECEAVSVGICEYMSKGMAGGSEEFRSRARS